jgi:hypothetical protein
MRNIVFQDFGSAKVFTKRKNNPHAAMSLIRRQFQGRRLQQMEKKTNKFIEVLKALRYVLLVAGIIAAYIGAVELFNYLAKNVW